MTLFCVRNTVAGLIFGIYSILIPHLALAGGAADRYWNVIYDLGAQKGTVNAHLKEQILKRWLEPGRQTDAYYEKHPDEADACLKEHEDAQKQGDVQAAHVRTDEQKSA